MKRRLLFLYFCIVFLIISCPLACSRDEQTVQVSSLVASNADIVDDVTDLFVGRKNSIDEEVFLGGYPIGITIDGDGVVVVGLNEFLDENGNLCCPALACGLQINDVIVQLDKHKIYGSSKLSEIATASKGNVLKLKYLRDGTMHETQILPIKDIASGQYRLGLWTRDSSSGVGTLTYTRKNLQFGSLGHPIIDQQGNIVSCNNGGVFNCVIDGIEKGKRGNAGELKGSFVFDERIGNMYRNNKFGTFGNFNKLPDFCKQTIKVADISQVKIGKAQIYCTLDDNVRKAYDVEIVKAVNQKTASDKGLVLHVTDKDLLLKTGGIVQGMSGSPIVQDGKLVGAVTHVFVNDPTRGYGIYAKWMLQN